MLQLILGISGTGKTGWIMAEMKVRAAAHRKSVLIVPEQFSSSAETMVYRALGDALGAYAKVYSFTSYAEYVLRLFGGTAIKTLTDAARTVAVRRAMDTLGDELNIYGRQRHNTGFCSMCADAIKELKTAGADASVLLSAAQTQGEQGAKLRELGLIFAAYETVIGASAMDPSDRIAVAAQRLCPDILQDTAVYIDNFDGFTAPEYQMLEKLVEAQACTVALCCDSLADEQAGLGLFSPVKKTAQTLRRIAEKNGVAVAAPKIMGEDIRHKNVPGLLNVNEQLAYSERIPGESSGFYVTPAAGIYEECKAVACRIAALVQQQELRYGQIAVICREMEHYAAPIQYEFSLAGIPYFSDETTSPEHTALAAFFTAALEMLSRGITTESILRMLKTDLCGFTPEQIAQLENYAYTWQLKAQDWRAPFEKSPEGFGGEMNESVKKQLEELESLRSTIIERLQTFRNAALGGTAAQISKQLYLLLESFGGDANTIRMAQEFEAAGDVPRSRAVYSAWENMMKLLGQMEQLLGQDEVTASEYAELFALLLRATDLGHVPQTQDAVIVTTADRMRLDDPQVCFVLGVNEGGFPKLLGASGLLSHADRDLLVRNGVEMPGSFENRSLLEQMFFYRALTAPARALYVSYISPECGSTPPASALMPLVETLDPPADVLTTAQRAPTPAAALDLLGGMYREDTPKAAALFSALSLDKTTAMSLDAMQRASRPMQFKAEDTMTLSELLGSEMTISPTRVEQYYRCHFSYFLQYVLRIRPRKRAELSPLESGSLVHYILEQVLRTAGASFADLKKEELSALAGSIADSYVEKNMPAGGERFEYFIERMKNGVTQLLLYLQKEQAQSDFHPVAFEQEIGIQQGAIPPLCVKTKEGHTVRVQGKIDRVDLMQRGGRNYLRVVDYKTGSKTFRLDEVYCGLNTQMLLYLFMVCRYARRQDPDVQPAGVLYLSGDPRPKTEPRHEVSDSLEYRVDGLVLDDEVVLKGMDRDSTGKYVPCKFGKTGKRLASGKIAQKDKLDRIEMHLETLVAQMAGGLYEGQIDAVPLCTQEASPCTVCDYRAICLHEDGRGEKKVTAPQHVFEAEHDAPLDKEDGQG